MFGSQSRPGMRGANSLGLFGSRSRPGLPGGIYSTMGADPAPTDGVAKFVGGSLGLMALALAGVVVYFELGDRKARKKRR